MEHNMIMEVKNFDFTYAGTQKPSLNAITMPVMKNKITEFLHARKINSDIDLPKYSDKQIKDIIENIYEPQYGARPLERYIQDEIEPLLIKKIMEKKK